MKSAILKNIHWKKEWTEFAVLVLALRLIYAAIGIVIVMQGGSVELDAPIYGVLKPYLKTDLFSHWLVNPWFQWDTVSYFKIAMTGYSPDASIAFMPLYPMLIRFTAPLFGGNYLLAGLFLSTLFCFITLVLLYELVTNLYSEQVARQTILMYMAFPTAFFLLAAYTEALFMMLVLAFWMLARNKHWGWATLFAGLATLARLQGVILAPVMLWMMLINLVEQPASTVIGQLRQVVGLFKAPRKNILNSKYKFNWLLTLVPVVVATTYQSWLYNSGLGVITDALKENWYLKTVMPWEGVVLFFKRLFITEFIYMDWIDLGLFIVILAAAVVGLFLLDPGFSLYVWLTLAVLFTRGTPPHLLASFSRYFLALFPLFVLPALIRNKYLQLFIVTISFSLQALLVWIFLWGSWVA